MKSFQSYVSHGLNWVGAFTQRFSIPLILFFLLISVGSVFYTVKNLGVNTDLSEMISKDLEFHKRWMDYKEAFPYLSDTIVLVIRGEANEIQKTLPALKNEFLNDGETFEKVFSVEELESKRAFLEIKPKMDYQAILPAEPGLLKAQKIIQKEDYQNLDIKITGAAALAYEELKSVSEGAWISALLSLLLASIILIWAFRSGSLILVTLLNLLVGLILTAGFATLAVGHLNMISVAFAVLFIGLGIDFSIHLCLRCREKVTEGIENKKAIRLTLNEMGGSLFLCMLTTASGFFAFVPTSYLGVSELGLISGVGMLINFLVHMVLLPALLHQISIKPKKTSKESAFKLKLLNFPLKYPKWILRSTVILVGLSLGGVFFIKFDSNPLNLQDPTSVAFKTYQQLLQEPGLSPWTIKILKKNKEEVKASVEKLEKIPEVGKILSIDDLSISPQELKNMPSSHRQAYKNKLEEMTPRFVSEEGLYRIEVFPKENINDVEKMRVFANAVLAVEPTATDDPVTIPYTGDAVVDAFQQAGLTAVFVIFLLLCFILKSAKDATLVLVPIAVGGILCVGVMEILSLDFNFANIIVLPLLLGIGVDSGVHLIHQYRHLGSFSALFKSTSSGVFFSALTTVSSFGTLALSSHRGTASMGLILTIGTLLMMVSTLMVLPAMLAMGEKGDKELKKVA